jgi:single-strand DNA-binding protein
MDIPDEDLSYNEVVLRGRLAGPPVERELPSGDVITIFRLTVRRPDGKRGTVDSLDCAAERARCRRSLARAAPGDVLEIRGSLRRRFWRGPAGVSSRYEVRAESVRSLRSGRAGRRSAASAGRTQASG